jgi:hypothetical protein
MAAAATLIRGLHAVMLQYKIFILLFLFLCRRIEKGGSTGNGSHHLQFGLTVDNHPNLTQRKKMRGVKHEEDFVDCNPDNGFFHRCRTCSGKRQAL